MISSATHLTLDELNALVDKANEVGDNHLYLGALTSIPEGFNPTFGGDLDLDALTSIPEGFNPTVGGDLYLRSLKSIPEGFNPTVGGNLNLYSLTSIPEGFNPTIGGCLNLYSLKSIPEGFNPTVGGNLWLNSLTSIPEGFNPTVGGNLWLRSLTSIPEGFNPTVGGSLYTGIKNTPRYTKLRDGDYVEGKYIYADGILTHIKSKHVYGEYTFYHGKIKGHNVLTDGKLYAHGESFKQCLADLEFKKAKDRGAKQYEHLTSDSVVKKNDAIVMYRIITGACQQGTERFLATIKEFKEEYTVAELIEITRGQYRADVFEEFFKRSEE